MMRRRMQRVSVSTLLLLLTLSILSISSSSSGSIVPHRFSLGAHTELGPLHHEEVEQSQAREDAQHKEARIQRQNSIMGIHKHIKSHLLPNIMNEEEILLPHRLGSSSSSSSTSLPSELLDATTSASELLS